MWLQKWIKVDEDDFVSSLHTFHIATLCSAPLTTLNAQVCILGNSIQQLHNNLTHLVNRAGPSFKSLSHSKSHKWRQISTSKAWCCLSKNTQVNIICKNSIRHNHFQYLVPLVFIWNAQQYLQIVKKYKK